MRAPAEDSETGCSSVRLWLGRTRGAETSGSVLPFIVLASLTSMMEGYDMGIIANAQLIIQEDLMATDGQMEVLVGCLNLIALLGSLLAGYLADSIGRTATITVVLSILIAGAFLMSIAPGYAVLLAGRIITGVGVGGGLVIIPVYTAELSAADCRGQMVTLIEIMINSGILLGYVVGWAIAAIWPAWTSSWRLMLGIGGLLPLTLSIGTRQLPESPRWLMSQNRMEESRNVLKVISANEQEVDAAMLDIQRSLELEKESRKPSPIRWVSSGWYGLLFTSGSTRRALLSAGGIAIIQVAIGSSAIVYYTPQILAAAGITSKLHKMAGTVVMGATKTTAVLGGMGDEAAATTYTAVPLICLCFFMVFFSFGLGPGVSVVASETFPLRQRSRGLSLCAAVNRVVSGTVVVTFLSLTKWLNVSGTFLGYSVLGCIGFVHILVFVPETKGMTLEAITSELSVGGEGTGFDEEECDQQERQTMDNERAALVTRGVPDR